MDRPLPFASFISSRSTGRGRLPTWVVRILFVLRFIDPPFLPHLHLLAPIENSYDPAQYFQTHNRARLSGRSLLSSFLIRPKRSWNHVGEYQLRVEQDGSCHNTLSRCVNPDAKRWLSDYLPEGTATLMIELFLCGKTATQQTGLSHALHTCGERVGRATPAELVHIAEEARVGPERCKTLEQ